MTGIELQEKINNAEEKVNKIKNTIERHKKQAEKKLMVIKNNNWNENDKYCMRDTAQFNESYWAICEYENKLDDIINANSKLKDAEIILSNWIEKYNNKIASENVINNEMPKIFIDCRNELADDWTETDIKQREVMKIKRKELSYEEFRKIYKYTTEQSLSKTDEEFYKNNLKDAEFFIIDLYNRVKNITGEVTDWKNIYYGGKALNGFIVGVKGKAKVETILAGGYNIQRLHMRVLVNEVK